MRKTGNYETLGTNNFFIPDALPPKNPNLQLDNGTIELYSKTMEKLGILKGVTSKLKNHEHFIKAYINKEAQLSSAIEGINTTILDIFTQQDINQTIKTKYDKNAELALNYSKAIHAAISMVKNDNMPITSRIILKAHEELMSTIQASNADPGNYRKQMVKVGNLTPAQANKIPELMSELEKFINTDETIFPVIKAGLAHVQFETIHPFLDGNGRIGRLLIVLMLIECNALSEAILYPSYYFKKRNLEYYKMLDNVRTNGDFEGWIKYYLSVIKDSCSDAIKRIDDIENLKSKILEQISYKNGKNSKPSENKLNTLEILFEFPVINASILSQKLQVSYNTASKIILDFINIGILEPLTKQKRGKIFKLSQYFEILDKDYDDTILE